MSKTLKVVVALAVIFGPYLLFLALVVLTAHPVSHWFVINVRPLLGKWPTFAANLGYFIGAYVLIVVLGRRFLLRLLERKFVKL